MPDTEPAARRQPAGVRRSVIRGGSTLAAGTLIERLARLGRNMVLARLLAPEHFGLMAITLAVIALFEALTEVGVAQAVIQNKRGNSAEFLNVAWWFGLVRGVVVAAIAWPVAPLVAALYEEPDLTLLIGVAATSMLFTGITSPRIYALQRQFRFGATLWTSQGAGLLGTAMTLALAFYWRSVWALVIGLVLEAFARCVLSFILCPIRPSLSLDKRSRQELFRFTRGMAGVPILTFLMMQADTFVLGLVGTAGQLGVYAMAIGLATFPQTIFGKVVQPLLVPLFANLQQDLPAMRALVLRVSRLVWLFGLPMVAVMAAVAEPLLVLVYGRQVFAEASTAFAVYAGFMLVYMASMVTFSVYLALAMPHLHRRFTIVRAVLVVIAIYPLTVALGGTGAALALCVAMLGAMGVQLFSLRSAIGLRVSAYLGTMRAGLVLAAAVLVPLIATHVGLDLADWATVTVGAVTGALAWTVALLHERSELRRLKTASRGASAAGGGLIDEGFTADDSLRDH